MVNNADHPLNTALNRRKLVGGAIAGAAAIGMSSHLPTAMAQDSTPAAPGPDGFIHVDPGTPPAEIFNTLHQLPLTTSGDTFKIMVTDEVKDWINNDTTRWMEEQTGVKIEWEVIPIDGAIDQLNLTLAGGDLPDAVMGYVWTQLTPSQLSIYGQQGFFIDLKDKLADNAPNFTKLSADLSAAQNMVTSPNGAIYSLPQINDCYHCSMTQKFWINETWIEKLGLTVPTTPDEMKAVLEAFLTQDPNGNGTADEIPMSVSAGTGLGDLDAFLMNPFQFSPGESAVGGPWLYLDGEKKVTTAYTQDGWRDGIKYMRDLYAANLLDHDSFTQTADQLAAKAKNPDTPLIGGEPSFWKATHQDFNSSYFKEYKAIPQLTGPTGLRQTYKNYYRPGTPSGMMITSSCKNPDLLLKWADNIYATEATLRVARGAPGINWRWAEQGEMGINGEQAVWAIITQPADAPTNVYRDWQEHAPMWFSGDLRLSQAVVVPRDDETETILYDATKDMQEPYAVPQSVVLPPLAFDQDQSSTITLNGQAITDLVKQQYASWVSGDGDPDADWDGYLEQLNSVGYDDYLSAYQTAWEASVYYNQS